MKKRPEYFHSVLVFCYICIVHKHIKISNMQNLSKTEFRKLVKDAKSEQVSSMDELDDFVLDHEYSDRITGADHDILRQNLKISRF